MWASLGKSKWKVLDSVFITSLFSPNNYNDLTKFLYFFFVILLCWYKRCSTCLISFLSLHELCSAFICANNTGSLVNNFFGVKNFNPFLSFTSRRAMVCVSTNSSLSLSSGGVDGITSIFSSTPSSVSSFSEKMR